MFELFLHQFRQRACRTVVERLLLDLEFCRREGIIDPRTAERLAQKIAVWDLLRKT